MKIKKAILFIIGVIGLVNIVFQARAGELGNSRGSSLSETSRSHVSKIGSYVWINNVCFKVGYPKSEIVQTYEEAIQACPKLRDDSAVQGEYAAWANQAKANHTPIPPHAPGSICKTKHSWFWAQQEGSVDTKCKVYLPNNEYIEGVRI